MHSCDFDDSFQKDVFWIDFRRPSTNSSQIEFTITDLAKEFSITLARCGSMRARGLLTPVATAASAFFNARTVTVACAESKKLAFTLARDQPDARGAGRTVPRARLEDSSEKCLTRSRCSSARCARRARRSSELRSMHPAA